MLLSYCYNSLYYFPIAITKLHKLSGLKPHKFIILQFWRSEAKNQGVDKIEFLLEALGEYLLPCLF